MTASPQTFILTNNTNANIRVLKIIFDVEPGITPLVDLSELGGSSNYQDTDFAVPDTQQAIVTAGGTKTINLSYTYQSGSNGQKHASVVVWATGQLTTSMKNTVIVVSAPSPSPSPSPSPTPSPAPSPSPSPVQLPVVAINAGGPTYTAVDGTVFLSDRHYSGGIAADLVMPIANTQDDTIYQTERYGAFTYTIPVTNSTYQVTLHLAEIYSPNYTLGARVFGFKLQPNTANQVQISDIDLFELTGFATAYTITRTVTVTNQSLVIESVPQVENPKLSAISITSAAGGQYVPPITPSPVPGTQIPRPSTGPGGTGISQFILESPSNVSPLLLGIHSYTYPSTLSYQMQYAVSPATIGYKVRRSVNYNESSNMYWIWRNGNTPDWTGINDLLDTCYADGAQLLFTAWLTPPDLVQGTGNQWPSVYPNFYGSTSMPNNLSVWQDRVRQVVNYCQTRHPGVLVGVEVWNEPDIDGRSNLIPDLDNPGQWLLYGPYWLGSVPYITNDTSNSTSPQRLQDLRDLHKATYLGVKASTNPVPVHGPAFSPGPISNSQVQTYYNGNCTTGGTPKDYTERYGGHCYSTGINATSLLAVFQQYVNNRNAVNPAWEVWNTEAGDETRGGLSPANHAISIKRKAMIAAALGYKSSCYYSWEDYQYLGNPGGGGALDQFGGTTQHQEPLDALKWVTDNIVGRTLDWSAILDDGRVCCWFRDGSIAAA